MFDLDLDHYMGTSVCAISMGVTIIASHCPFAACAFHNCTCATMMVYIFILNLPINGSHLEDLVTYDGCGSEEMELEDVQTDLHALRKLYGLLQIKVNSLQNADLKNLDENARLLLKKLLDGATEQAFQSHSKIVSGQSAVSHTPYTKPKKSEVAPELLSLVSPDKPNTSIYVTRNNAEDLNSHPITLQEDEQSQTKQTAQATFSGQAKLKVAATESRNRTKCCRICGESTLKQLNSAEEKKIPNEKSQNLNKDCVQDYDPDQYRHHHDFSQHRHGLSGHIKELELKEKAKESHNISKKTRLKRIHEIQRNPSIVRSDLSSSSAIGVIPESRYSVTEKIKKKPEKPVDISEEVATAIRWIEAHIPVDQPLIELARLPESGYNVAEKIEKKPENPVNVSEEVANATQRIEAPNPFDQLLTEISPMKENNMAHYQLYKMRNLIHGTDVVSPMIQRKDEVLQSTGDPNFVLRQTSKPLLDGNEWLSQKVNQKRQKSKDTILSDQVLNQLNQTCKPIPKRNNMLSRIPSQKGGGKVQETILQDQQLGQTRKLVPKSNELPSQMMSQNDRKTKETPDQAQKIYYFSSQRDGKSMEMPMMGQICGRNGKPVLERNETLSKLTSQKDRKPNQIRRLNHERNYLTSQKDGRAKGTTLPTQMLRRIYSNNVDRNPTNVVGQRETTRKVLTSRPLLPVSTVGSTLKDRSINNNEDLFTILDQKQSRRRDILSQKDHTHQMIMRPTLLDQKPSQMTVAPIRYNVPTARVRSGIHYNAQAGPCKKPLPYQRKAEETSTSSSSRLDSSSSWTTQQSSSSVSGDSLSGRVLTHRHMGPELRRGQVVRGKSVKRNFPHRMQGRYAGPPRRTSSAGSREKEIGRLRRFKKKLAVIFHHHHHHHHYHDDDDSDQAEVDHARSSHHRSPWKYVRKIFHHPGEEDHRKVVAEVYGERVAKNSKKSAVRRAPRLDQPGHLHALLEWLFRHLWYSKKSKLSKGDVRRLGKTHSHKKVVKKLHWWQNFHRRGGVRMPNSGKPHMELVLTVWDDELNKMMLRDFLLREAATICCRGRTCSICDDDNGFWLNLLPKHTICGSCGYELNLSSSNRNTSTIGSKYGKSIKRGIISFFSIDESRFTQVDELRCVPFFVSKHSWGLFRRKTKLLCRKCGNYVGNAYEENTSYPLVSDGSDTTSGDGTSVHRKYDVKIRTLQPSEESGVPLFI
ncbi:hypothetical protein HHK36_004331 [Tetracentron sinense]|uniref:Uncharacterized protein n=1 Tax=Tetracentron sinense TaxID=13715 RepID=A0A835A069_TETSI|nr:hypothetical protein HHK36_004331 [Tetracentron sinense]